MMILSLREAWILGRVVGLCIGDASFFFLEFTGQGLTTPRVRPFTIGQMTVPVSDGDDVRVRAAATDSGDGE